MQFVRAYDALSGEQRVAMHRSLGICVLYGGTSIAISFMYKAVLSVYAFDAKFTLLALQMLMGIVFCAFAKARLGGVPGLEVPDLDPRLLREYVPAGMLNFANVAVGWYGLQLVNVPMFLCIRRTATAFTLLAEWYVLGKVASPTIRGAVGLVVAGAVVAGWESLSRDWLGYLYTMGNNMMTALSLTHTKAFSDRNNVRGFGIVLYNAYVGLPVALLGAALTGELGYIARYPHLWEPGFLVAVTSASLLGVFMSYIVFLCTTVNSPLATSVTGNMKDVLSTVLAMALFSGFQPTVNTVLGLMISFSGSGVFSFAKLVEAGAVKPPLALVALAATAGASGGQTAAGGGLSINARGKETADVEAGAGAYHSGRRGSGSNGSAAAQAHYRGPTYAGTPSQSLSGGAAGSGEGGTGGEAYPYAGRATR
jgi:solute carrier family 35 protein